MTIGELIISGVQKNIKNPRLYAALAGLIVIMAIIFPYIDANFFFYNRIEKRASIMQTLSEIDTEKVASSPALQEEYNSILVDIEKQRDKSIFGVITSEQQSGNVLLFKFLSGGLLAWIIALCVPLMDTFEDNKAKVIMFLFLVFVGGILGGVGYVIPTIVNPWVNYIGFPILQLIMLIGLVVDKK
jgi:hypothetical protein